MWGKTDLKEGLSLDEYNDYIETMRKTEYPMLQDSIYLDHAGATLCSKSTMDGFAHDMTTTLYGNPHSASWPSQQSTARIENARLRLLAFFGANPADFDLVFVANATAGVKIVVEGMRSVEGGFLYAHHQACHTSIVGIRGEARASICIDDEVVQNWIEGDMKDPFASTSVLDATECPSKTTLVAYSAQSHMDGTRYPLSWSRSLRSSNNHGDGTHHIYTLLDAASLSATSPLDLGDHDNAPDFTVVSLYKIFGFPDLGALIVRRDAQSVFSQRSYFGGGTVDMVLCGKETWHAPKTQFLHERLEDGTLPFHNIMALDTAMTAHQRLFRSMSQVKDHVGNLAEQLLHGLTSLRHGNGERVCVMYGNESCKGDRGPVVSFNIKNSAGAWISLAEVGKLAQLRKIHIRTGGVCSPCSIASALDLEPWEIRSNFSAGFRCGTESDIMSGKPTGVIRASLGAMSTKSDVASFVEFIQEFYAEAAPLTPDSMVSPLLSPIPGTRRSSGLQVGAITLYPIKSCAGLPVPPGTRWEIRPEGLTWDREWCLVHRGSGQTLSQKRYPGMALLKPSIDFAAGHLRVDHVKPGSSESKHITVPLSVNPALFDSSNRHMPSRVCGDEISPYIYSSSTINDFFSDALGVPCYLARLPSGGRGLGSRSSKAVMQAHQRRQPVPALPGTFPLSENQVPSPPDSDSEKQRREKPGSILLANESPMLLIYSASVDALNRDIQDRGERPVDESAFRANVSLRPSLARDEAGSVEHSDMLRPFAEDSWTSLRIGPHTFTMLGACRRCQMVCVDQATAEKRQEPYVTLAKTRRFDGKVFFGCHMRHEPVGVAPSGETQYPTIQVGDLVTVEDGRD